MRLNPNSSRVVPTGGVFEALLNLVNVRRKYNVVLKLDFEVKFNQLLISSVHISSIKILGKNTMISYLSISNQEQIELTKLFLR